MKNVLASCLHLAICVLAFGQTSFGQSVLFRDDFSQPQQDWRPLALAGSGTANINNGKLEIATGNTAGYGLYLHKPLSGHFEVEVDFGMDDHVGLALFKAENGAPDPNNYSMVRVDMANSAPTVSLQDKQNGIANVWDCTNKADKNSRYKNTLNGSQYSIPFVGTAKKLRILRHAGERFIHFYYLVSKTIRGVTSTGWAEIAPSKEWPQLNGSFYVALVANGGNASFDNFVATSLRLNDHDDSQTGFAATEREYVWSGYRGNAIVVTFDKREAPLTEGKRKFVFWAENNYVPAWHLDDQLQYTVEFVETWGGGSPGCLEPMSDRLLRYSQVELVENTATRKVVHWHYVLHDPDYRTPDQQTGNQLPEVDEYYYIYYDGTILRQIQYRPKLDAPFRNWHELSEFIVTAGQNTDPKDHMANPCLSIWPISGSVETYYPTGGSTYDQAKNDATVIAAHFKNHPDVYEVFNDRAQWSAATYAGSALNIYKTWHDIGYGMTHWPISKEQYYTDAFKSGVTWPEQIKHAAIAGVGAYYNTDWNSNIKTDASGRKYREWIALISLGQPGSLAEAKPKAQKWLAAPLQWTLPARNEANLSWHFQRTLEGWHGLLGADATVANSIASLAITAPGSSMLSPQHLAAQANVYQALAIRLKNNTPSGQAKLYWTTTADPNFDEAKSVTFSLKPSDNSLRTYVVDLGKLATWTGTIEQLKLVPSQNATTGTVELDYLKLLAPYNSLKVPGTIEAEDFNRGGSGNAYLDEEASNEGQQYRTNEGVDIETCSEGGYNVGWIKEGEWIEYLFTSNKTANYNVVLRASSPDIYSKCRLSINDEPVSSSIALPKTGSYQTFVNVPLNSFVTLPQGYHLLKMEALSGGFNLNKFIFSENLTTHLETEVEVHLCQLSPNPVQDEVTLTLPQFLLPVKVQVMNLQGHVLSEIYQTESKHTLGITDLKTGVYLVKAGTCSQKLIIF